MSPYSGRIHPNCASEVKLELLIRYSWMVCVSMTCFEPKCTLTSRISSGSLADTRAGALPRKPRGSLSPVLCTLHSKCQLISCRRYRINYLDPTQLRGNTLIFMTLELPAIIFISQEMEAAGDIIRPGKLSLKHNCLAKLLFFEFVSVFTIGLLQVTGCLT